MILSFRVIVFKHKQLENFIARSEAHSAAEPGIGYF